MNDASEVTYVSDILKSVINEAKSSVHGDDECELLERISKAFDITEMLRVFALCFSELHDSIPWGTERCRLSGEGIWQRSKMLLSRFQSEQGKSIRQARRISRLAFDTLQAAG